MVVDYLRLVTDPVPNAIKDKFGSFFTLFELEAEGRILGRAGGYDACLPKPITDFGRVTFGRLAEKIDFEIIDPPCVRDVVRFSTFLYF